MKNIFIIDDDIMFQKILKHKVDEAGYKVFCYASVEDAISEIDINPSLIILDHNFKSARSKGSDYLKLLKQLLIDTSFIYVTSETNPDIISKSLAQGADMYLEKDENLLDKINDAIHEVLNKKKSNKRGFLGWF